MWGLFTLHEVTLRNLTATGGKYLTSLLGQILDVRRKSYILPPYDVFRQFTKIVCDFWGIIIYTDEEINFWS